MASGWRLEIGSVLVKLRLWAEQNVVPVQKGHFSSTIIAPRHERPMERPRDEPNRTERRRAARTAEPNAPALECVVE